MAVEVECYAGYRGEQEPRSFRLGERRLEVLEIVDRWMEPGRRWFKCRASDGHAYILHHDQGAGTWELAAFTRST
ncbi:MAG TPA: hypothetical protein VLX30_09740 [Burkholderiales bacterium]|nr:hypothetical protein [Burkholderiales bacterium]